MLTHVVMWRLHAQDAAQRTERVAAVVEAFEALRGTLPGLLELQVGANQASGDDVWDVALVTVFDSPQALEDYNNDPRHLEIKKLVKPWRRDRAVVDWARH